MYKKKSINNVLFPLTGHHKIFDLNNKDKAEMSPILRFMIKKDSIWCFSCSGYLRLAPA